MSYHNPLASVGFRIRSNSTRSVAAASLSGQFGVARFGGPRECLSRPPRLDAIKTWREWRVVAGSSRDMPGRHQLMTVLLTGGQIADPRAAAQGDCGMHADLHHLTRRRGSVAPEAVSHAGRLGHFLPCRRARHHRNPVRASRPPQGLAHSPSRLNPGRAHRLSSGTQVWCRRQRVVMWMCGSAWQTQRACLRRTVRAPSRRPM